jgi:uncharacterized SAM-binding protein YcdF (DUF218 family)
MRRRTRRLIAGLSVAGAVLGAARLALPSVPGWFIRANRLAPCDLIVVTGSNPAGSTEIEGVRLWRQGMGRRLLCVGRLAAWNVTEDEVMVRHARALGVPPDRLLRFHIPFSVAPDAGTMREEARRLLPFLRTRGVRSVLVVSSDIQSRRKSLLLKSWRRAGVHVLVHPIPGPDFHADGWWRRKLDTKVVVGEVLGWLTLPFGH